MSCNMDSIISCIPSLLPRLFMFQLATVRESVFQSETKASIISLSLSVYFCRLLRISSHFQSFCKNTTCLIYFDPFLLIFLHISVGGAEDIVLLTEKKKLQHLRITMKSTSMKKNYNSEGLYNIVPKPKKVHALGFLIEGPVNPLVYLNL